MSDLVGNTKRLVATFAYLGDPTDPTGTITMRVTTPSGATTLYTYGGSPALLKFATGVYYVDVVLNVAGVWKYRSKGTVSGTLAVQEATLNVTKSIFSTAQQ